MLTNTRVCIYSLIIVCSLLAGCTGLTPVQHGSSEYSNNIGESHSYWNTDDDFDDNWD